MRHTGRTIGTLAAALIALSACSDGSGDEAAPAAKASTAPGVVAVSKEQETRLGLKWAAAQGVTEAAIATLPGTIAPPPNARVAVTPLYPGVIRRIYVAPGDAVRAGQPLALVASADVLSRGADLARAQAQLRVAQANAGRLGKLAREGVIAGARADEANAQLRQAQVDVSEQNRLLGMAGASGRSGTYTLSAPITGRISKMTAEAGSQVDPMQAPFVVDAVADYEVTAQVPESLLGQVHPGMSVKVGEVSGTISSVSQVLDPETRSATLRAKIPGGTGVVSGGSTTVQVRGPAPAGAVRVPATAVTNLSGSDIVFVKANGGVAQRKVRAGATVDGQTLVLSGLKPGEQVAASGTSELKALVLAQ
ncbi:MAG: efflux RND transporter periplasmic adaptor subunit [Sphingomonadales bacterium]|nr:efflux RND transporter periplasmic adaptor subunit [Sphingomonadales bacterium]MDE2569119.1 efflux RND transporter periplasmic adaptor subunit [Sphingomonadales bacterium]